MDSSSATAGGRSSASLPAAAAPVVSPQSSSRKEWRAIPDHSFRNPEETYHTKMAQIDERSLYEEGARLLEADFCSITIEDGSDISSGGEINDDMVRKQQILNISRRRMELQDMENELRSQSIARSEIFKVQKQYEAQIKENTSVATELKEKLQEKEKRIHELELQIEHKEMELRAIKIDNETAWAKEDLLRVQNEELANFRRDHDNTEAKRVELRKQIHDLHEHIQEKDKAFLELKDQHRILQEGFAFKEAELREAQNWIGSVQMEALQSAANQALQAELQERTEQFNQYWAYLVRQCAEAERHFLQIIQQQQIDLAEAREHNVNGDSQTSHANPNDSSSCIESKGNQFNENGNGITNENGKGVTTSISNGTLNSAVPVISHFDASARSEHGSGITFVPPATNIHPYVPHPFVMHPQGPLHSMPSANQHISQSQLGHFLSIPAMPSNQNFPSQQEEKNITYIPNHNQHQLSQANGGALQPGAYYGYNLSSDDHINQTDYSESSNSPVEISGSIVTGSNDNAEALESHGDQYGVSQETMEISNDNSQNCSTEVHILEENNGVTVHNEILVSTTIELQRQILKPDKLQSSTTFMDPEISIHSSDSHVTDDCVVSVVTKPVVSNSEAKTLTLPSSGTAPCSLLDEKSLLACIVRAVPALSSGPIRISTTLPNRLGKMLAPLHWHDYKKQYGKLADLVTHHPELFVIEGDYIHLREGAQKIVSANRAAVKFAAATAASLPCLPHSVVVTPVAQGHCLKRCQSTDVESVSSASVQLTNNKLQPVVTKYHQLNGYISNVGQNQSDVPNKSKYLQEVNTFPSETQTRNSTLNRASSNGMIVDQSSVTSLPSNNNMRHGVSSLPSNNMRYQGRSSGAGPIGRR